MIGCKHFLETDALRAMKIRDYLQENRIVFQERPIRDLVHFDIENLTDAQLNELKRYYKQLEPNQVEKKHRKWDERYHTLGESIAGYVTGETDREDVDYSEEK